MSSNDLIEQAKEVLDRNKKEAWTSPSPVYYRHQWLWDTAFIAIGISNYNPQQAARELLSLKRGQWQNGMLPHVIFATRFHDMLKGPLFWQWRKSKLSSKKTVTSAITQPPMVAIAAAKVAKELKGEPKIQFLKQVLPMLESYHRWVYRERNPEGSGLIVVIHPWETGLDNTPAWAELLKQMPRPWWVRFLNKSGLFEIVMRQRKGAKMLDPDERTNNLEIMQAARLILRFRAQAYVNKAIFSSKPVATESLAFNSILIKANSCLIELAEQINYQLPQDLLENFNKTKEALNTLWDEDTKQYYSRDFSTKKLIKTPSITTFLPLFSEGIGKDRAEKLVKNLLDKKKYWTKFPVPTVPLDSPYFNQKRFWQGPVWINTNWMITRGLEHYGYQEEAKQIVEESINLVQNSGFCEYFSPLTGEGLGVKSFSWSAALLIDLLSSDGS